MQEGHIAFLLKQFGMNSAEVFLKILIKLFLIARFSQAGF